MKYNRKRQKRINVAVTDRMKEDVKDFCKENGFTIATIFEDMFLELMARYDYKDYREIKESNILMK